MRFPVVLFDFDGTVIDSGAIIIASMRHATKTVLGREIPDEELGRAVGGSGLVDQMRLIDPTRVVRPGDEIEALEVVGLRSDRVLLRPEPGAVGLEEIREVWLLRAERADEPRLRVLRTRDESLGAVRGALPVPTEAPAPKGARTVRRTVSGGGPR